MCAKHPSRLFLPTPPNLQPTFLFVVLVGLYEEGEKPSNALDYVKKNFGSANSGASAADADEVQSLKEEIASLKARNEELEARLSEAMGGGDADGE